MVRVRVRVKVRVRARARVRFRDRVRARVRAWARVRWCFGGLRLVDIAFQLTSGSGDPLVAVVGLRQIGPHQPACERFGRERSIKELQLHTEKGKRVTYSRRAFAPVLGE